MPCNHCPLRDTCQRPCPELERLLPREDHARLDRAFKVHAAQFLALLAARHAEVLRMLDYEPQLSGRLRQVFRMKYFDGLTHQEIGQKLGIARRVVGTYLERAHQLLGKLMSGRRRRQRGLTSKSRAMKR
ncbi:MAG: hypothetical protein DPW14_17380 [Planctomycetes bacterium]|nr:hypothetical protein [Planctomycetota bacterium]